ncbi:MAG: hypothetical protein MUC72_02450 [Acidobacteria bacterium]|nr:hypothetical protein [Acidobacteriota bacterium]
MLIEAENEQQHAGQKQRGGRQGDPHLEAPRGDGTVFFQRMQLVPAAVQDVVEDVHRSGDQAEEDERQQAPPDVAGLEHVQGEDHRGEDEDVLHPLLRAQGDQEVFQGLHGGIIAI